ncbi:hypothetical protein IAR55_005360 [Kwoniella newhampshirensis]|uniref:Uncharacterized protein n=1 Tax=Kwoniella newhampshirensis TaxID=1651941 RepID=A0AAW0YH70_9TREE
MQSSSRRSDAELQEILDTFVGDGDTVLTCNLPDLISKYERDHHIKILDHQDFHGVQELCEQYPDLELGPAELFGFLGAVLKQLPASRTTSDGDLPKSTSMPPSSFHGNDQSTPQQAPRRRRHTSDRIRSPSDSSSSESEEEATRRRQARQSSAPAELFPKSMKESPPRPSGWLPTRKKTLSDSRRSDAPLGSPLSARVRETINPPSAFGGFARPSPASRRKRVSSASTHKSIDDEGKSSESRSFTRSTSASSVSIKSSPPWKARYDSRPTSPMSPSDMIDNTSFHARAKSPEDDGEGDQFERNASGMGYVDKGEEHEVDHDVGQGKDSLDPRLSTLSTESSLSLRTSHDNLNKLRKENVDLTRKLKATEKTLAEQGVENERLIEDLQERLEEAQSELAQRRREEKELKGRERAHLVQISGFEADILSLQKSLENAKANHASMQKMYSSQCEEAQRLREMLRERDDEIRTLEESTDAHAADEEKFVREIAALEAEVRRVEADLAFAREAESHLDVQKQENLQLKETIDRMRFDLDEARTYAAEAVALHARGASVAELPNAGTLSRNLGDELNGRLLSEPKEGSGGNESEEESFVETIVTRTRKMNANSARRSTSPREAVKADLRVNADAGTETNPVAGPSHLHGSPEPPAYTAEPEPINHAEVLERAHPRAAGLGGVVDEEYEVLVDALGVRCSVLEDELKMKRATGGIISTPGRARTYWAQQRKQYQTGIVNYIFTTTDISVRDQVGKFAMLTIAAFAVGLVAGSQIYGSPVGIHPRDYHLFQQMNTLAGVAGVGEGFLPMSMLGAVEQGARMIAGVGRVPS